MGTLTEACALTMLNVLQLVFRLEHCAFKRHLCMFTAVLIICVTVAYSLTNDRSRWPCGL